MCNPLLYYAERCKRVVIYNNNWQQLLSHPYPVPNPQITLRD